MKWRKLGLVFCPHDNFDWMVSHAYLPTAVQLEPDRIRVFLAFRDREQVGRIGWIDVQADNPVELIGVAKRPALDVGRPGTFDDNGVSPLAVVREDERLRLYYAGWQLTPRARYLLFTGLALSNDGGESFSRYQETPVLDRSPKELIVRSGAHVMRDEGVWKIWYAAGSDFISSVGRGVPTYSLVYAESQDGLTWPSAGLLALTPQDDEFGFGRPSVLKHKGIFHMWYSVRTHSKIYRLGYGTSEDGVHWHRRDDEAGLDVSAAGWDSEMIGFASVIVNDQGVFMFYNGNGYGKTGVGVAVLESSF